MPMMKVTKGAQAGRAILFSELRNGALFSFVEQERVIWLKVDEKEVVKVSPDVIVLQMGLDREVVEYEGELNIK
jgi:hypothetical protein